MNRREALSTVALLVGGTVIGSEAFLEGCKSPSKHAAAPGLLTEAQMAWLDEVGETILPATPGSGGAKSVEIGAFMNSIVSDCYYPNDQKVFLDGLVKLEALSKSRYQKGFLDLSAADREKLLIEEDQAARDWHKTNKDKGPAHYFSMIKQLTLWGYFSSKEGATKALRYVAVPGRYQGDIPYKKGDKAWAT